MVFTLLIYTALIIIAIFVVKVIDIKVKSKYKIYRFRNPDGSKNTTVSDKEFESIKSKFSELINGFLTMKGSPFKKEDSYRFFTCLQKAGDFEEPYRKKITLDLFDKLALLCQQYNVGFKVDYNWLDEFSNESFMFTPTLISESGEMIKIDVDTSIFFLRKKGIIMTGYYKLKH